MPPSFLFEDRIPFFLEFAEYRIPMFHEFLPLFSVFDLFHFSHPRLLGFTSIIFIKPCIIFLFSASLSWLPIAFFDPFFFPIDFAFA